MTDRRRIKRQPLLAGFVPLEDRTAPAVFTATLDPAVDPTGAVAEIVGFFAKVNTNGEAQDTIDLFTAGKYVFTTAFDRFDGGTALPVFVASGPADKLTVNGVGATFSRSSSNTESFRFLRAQGNFSTGRVATLVVNGVTFSGGNAFDTTFPSRSGSIFGATQNGGAIRVDQALLYTNGVRFIGNQSAGDGGAVSLGNTREDLILGGHKFIDTIFDANIAKGKGGAVTVDLAGPVTFTNSTISNNQATKGAGGVDAFTTSVLFDRSTLTANKGDSGAVKVVGPVDVRDTLVRKNIATGIATAGIAGTSITATRSTFADNTNTGSVTGGSALNGSKITVVNSTIYRNVGGVAAIQATLGTVSIQFSTVTNNTSTFGIPSGAGIGADSLLISNTIVAKNQNADLSSTIADIQANTIVTSGFNFIGKAPANFKGATANCLHFAHSKALF